MTLPSRALLIDDNRLSPPRIITAVVIIAAAAALTIFLHHILAAAPPFQDEGDHANTGRLLASGAVMYRDAFNEKGPGLYQITAGFFALFGDRWPVIRRAADFSAIGSLLLIAALGAKRKKPVAGAVGALIYAALHAFFFGEVWQSESLLTPMMLCAVWLLSKDRDEAVIPARRFFFAGIAFFIATCVKQTAWAPAAVLVASWLIPGAGRVNRRSAGFFAAGLAIPWISEAGGFIAVGAWHDFARGYTFPWRLFQTSTYFYRPSLDEWFFQLPIWLMALAAVVEIFRTRSATCAYERRLRAAAIVGAVGLLYPSLFSHHLLPLLAVSSWLFAMTLAQNWADKKYAIAIMWFFNFTIFLLYPWATGLLQWERRLDPDEISARGAIVADLRTKTNATDAVFVFPHDPTYYFDANRQPPGRYGFLLPWTAPPIVVSEFLAEFDARPPAAVLYTYLNNCTPYGREPKDDLEPVLARFESGWRIENIFPNAVVWLTPDTAANENDRCRVRALFRSGISCGRKDAEWVEAQLDAACKDNGAVATPIP